MEVQNIYDPHTAIPVVKTFAPNVYLPQSEFPEVKTCVPNVYHI